MAQTRPAACATGGTESSMTPCGGPSLVSTNGGEIGPIARAQLLNLFMLHGAVLGAEFVADGFSIDQLLEQRLIVKSMCPLDGDRYLMGPALEPAARQMGIGAVSP